MLFLVSLLQKQQCCFRRRKLRQWFPRCERVSPPTGAGLVAISSEVVIEQVARFVGTAVVFCSYFLVVFPLRLLPLPLA